MTWTARMLTFALVAVSLVVLDTGRASAQTVFVSPAPVPNCNSAPAVTYYSPPVIYTPAPSVSYYYAPSVSYYTPSVSYYTPSVSYYPAPAVSYYAAPAAVTTTRYGLFGQPRVSTTYYPPVYVGR
jgi:hypothetical protein